MVCRENAKDDMRVKFQLTKEEVASAIFNYLVDNQHIDDSEHEQAELTWLDDAFRLAIPIALIVEVSVDRDGEV